MGKIMQSILLVIVLAVVLLLFGGAILDMVQNKVGHYDSFFNYKIRYLDRIQYWFIAVLVQAFLNGIMIPKLARFYGKTDFSPFRVYGQVNWNIPSQAGILFGRNLAITVVLLVLFLFVRSARL